MRIITWNCNGAFRRKFELLEGFKADVLIVQECEDPAQSRDLAYQAWAACSFWKGFSKSKGLGIFLNNSVRGKAIGDPAPTSQIFLPIRIDQIPLCAVWAHRDRSGWPDYIGQVYGLLEQKPVWLDDALCILAGDFNSNAIWDKRGRVWNHTEVVEKLFAKGMRSAYHTLCACEHGFEIAPTFFMQRNRLKAYHIDYVFVGRGWDVRRVEIGDADFWLNFSDHLPMIVDLVPRKQSLLEFWPSS